MKWEPLLLVSISCLFIVLLTGFLWPFRGYSSPSQESDGSPEELLTAEKSKIISNPSSPQNGLVDHFFYDYDSLSQESDDPDEALTAEEPEIISDPSSPQNETLDYSYYDYDYSSSDSVQYFKMYQFDKAEKDNATRMYLQDCNWNKTMKNAVIVAFQERHYGAYFKFYLQDMDDTKCALFLILSNGPSLIELPLIKIVSSRKIPTSCPHNAVMTAWYDDSNMFQFPDRVRCSKLPVGFRLGSCQTITIIPEKGKENPYERYISPYNQPADERWPLQCPQLPNPSALVEFFYQKNKKGKPYWRQFKCCEIEKTDEAVNELVERRGFGRVPENDELPAGGSVTIQPGTSENNTESAPVEYFKKLQYFYAEYDDEVKLYVQDCNRGRPVANAVAVALQERHYSHFFNYYMQDMDDMKCSVFPIFSVGEILTELSLIDVVSSETEWTTCPDNAVMTGLYDDEKTFSKPEKIKCSSLPENFERGQCTDILIEPEEDSYDPYGRFISDYDQPADVRWPMECPDRNSALAGLHFYQNDEGEPFWRGFRCCFFHRI